MTNKVVRLDVELLRAVRVGSITTGREGQLACAAASAFPSQFGSMSSSALISAVYRRKPLWDPLDVHHHNRIVIAKLWQEVSHELNINMMVAKAKWRGLRDYYRQQLRRNSEVGGTYSSGWAHFEEMSFLRATMSSSRPKLIKEEEEDMDEEGDGESFHSGGESSPRVDIARVLEQKWSPPPTEESESDDDLHFFKSLIPDMKGLPRATKSYIRLRIQQVVYDEIYAKDYETSKKIGS